MDVGAIPLAEIGAYLAIHGIDDPDDRADYVRFIQAMDATAMRVRRELRPKA